VSVHSANKQLLTRFLTELAEADEDAIASVLAAYCAPDCVWQIFHPFNRIEGNEAATSRFWGPLKASFPDYEHRLAFVLAGEYEGRTQVSSWGHVFGNFERAWLGIPPTWTTIAQRVGVNAIVQDGRFTKVYILLDIIDVMLQAGFTLSARCPAAPRNGPFRHATAGQPRSKRTGSGAPNPSHRSRDAGRPTAAQHQVHRRGSQGKAQPALAREHELVRACGYRIQSRGPRLSRLPWRLVSQGLSRP
jgi:hypothetical protein